MPEVEKVRKDVKSRCEGKLAMLFVGGSRAHHYQELFHEIGMETISAGYEFAHRDDYEGRKVIPNIVLDADTRNIEELKVTQDETRYRPRKDEAELEKMKKAGMTFSDYEGMMTEMPQESLVIDDLNHHEAEVLIEKYKPDIFCAGIKEKYVIQKGGIPLKQLHNYDYSGPYAGFRGAVNFYMEIDRLVNSKLFSFTKAPWEINPELTGNYGWNK
jgi:nitrogenase molybdenum-iron protein alpha chain